MPQGYWEVFIVTARPFLLVRTLHEVSLLVSVGRSCYLLWFLKVNRSFNLRNKWRGNLPAAKARFDSKRKKEPGCSQAAWAIEEARISTSPVTTFASTALAPGSSPEIVSGWRCICRLEGVPELTRCQVEALLTVALVWAAETVTGAFLISCRGAKIKKKPLD